MRNPLGYKVLKTYQQGQNIYELTKQFTAFYLHPIKDSRLIGHMNDSGRSVPRNISEGYGRNNTKQYLDFLGFALALLLELLEDCFSLEKEIKNKQRDTKDNEGALRSLSVIIKLTMGEKTMLKSQMEKLENIAEKQGVLPQNQRLSKIAEENRRKEKEFDGWLKQILDKERDK